MINFYRKAAIHTAFFLAILLVLPLAPATADETTQDQAQISRGAEAWANNCGRCHNVRDPKELEDYEWDVSVLHMRKVGNLPGEVARDIAAFLKASN